MKWFFRLRAGANWIMIFNGRRNTPAEMELGNIDLIFFIVEVQFRTYNLSTKINLEIKKFFYKKFKALQPKALGLESMQVRII